jgi:hypothetical protein
MLRSVAYLIVVCLLSVSALFAQAPVSAVCDFDPNTQLAVEYQPISVHDAPRPRQNPGLGRFPEQEMKLQTLFGAATRNRDRMKPRRC